MKNISLTTISNLLTILTGLLVAYNTYLVGKFNTELAEKESERELNFRIYESVIEALESENEKRILAIKVIVKSMANEKLKPGFLDVLETGEVKVFENEEVQKNPKVTPPKDNGKSKWKTWNFDLFLV
ncbi:MAG: hypothetical protein MI975_02225 [Cytophagales bacterium]|nr:hypothetical protein [Cytophagales bacterium]